MIPAEAAVFQETPWPHYTVMMIFDSSTGGLSALEHTNSHVGIYTPLAIGGPVFTLVTNLWLFGTWGVAMWLFEMAWIPFFAAGVINGLGHWWGYRNFQTPDQSRNLPGRFWSIITCGEALHNNHHHVQNSPRFAVRKGELDPGYWYFRALSFVGLARARQEETAAAA